MSEIYEPPQIVRGNVNIVEHCFGEVHKGGPATALKIFQSQQDNPYPEIWQPGPAGGLSVPLVSYFINRLRDLRPTLLHVRGLGNEGFHAALAGRLARVPHLLLSIHGTQRDILEPMTLRRWAVVNCIEPATLKLVDSIVTVCHSASQRSFLRPYRHKILPPVPNGVPLPTLVTRHRDESREQLGIGPTHCVAITVSRLSEQKGFIDLSRALTQIEKNSPEISLDLIIVGDGPEEKKIRGYFNGLKMLKVHFLGFQSNIDRYLEAADIFLLPSWHENLSIALLEAMAHQLPAIATAVGGNVEVLAHGGGILVPPHAPDAIARSLVELCRNPTLRREMGTAARETVATHYSVQHMASQWEERYRMTIARGEGSASI